MRSLILISLISILSSCTKPEGSDPICNPADYEIFLTSPSTNTVERLKKECEFWSEKISGEPRGFLYHQKLGAAQASLFEKTGNIDFLNESAESFKVASQLVFGKHKADNLLTQSSLAIKKHNFDQANHFALKARGLATEKFAAYMMQFDSEMELGNYELAKSILDRNTNFQSFDFLVRLSKFKDHEGNLDSAIFYMEKAYQMVLREESSRAIWATANLGDMYGHAGRVSDSYQKYLEALDQNATYDYALKGIAWIAYSADRNPKEAGRILDVLARRTGLPDNLLLLTEMADANGDKELGKEYIQSFLEEARKEKYGAMYNKYLVNLYSEEINNYDQAIELALQEVGRRSTPATNDWLAWAYYLSGQSQKALKVYLEKVEGKTYEPEVLYHMGVVYKNAGMEKQGLKLLNEALEASYELGPQISRKIEVELSSQLAYKY
ncbi:MAG: hypothetical protein ABJG78_14115 [Cyclobacteriaceae bacterium]